MRGTFRFVTFSREIRFLKLSILLMLQALVP